MVIRALDVRADRQRRWLALARVALPGKRRAQGLTEFALAVPIFLTMLFAMIEFGWAIYGFSTVQSAANEGVRRAIVLGRPASNYSATGNSLAGNPYTSPACSSTTIVGTVGCSILTLPKSRITVTLDVPDPADFTSGQNVPPGVQVSVTVRYQYLPLIAYPFNFATGYTLTGYATGQTQ